MIRQFICADGTVFAKSDGYDASVDEVIEFLEQFRGKRFWNSSSGEVAFFLDMNTICCNDTDGTLRAAYEKHQEIGKMVEAFFESDENYCEELSPLYVRK